MEFIGKAKIGKLSVKGINYPQLRLPRTYSSFVGKIADIFATEYEGRQAFFIITKDSVSEYDIVLKPDDEVLKLIDNIHIESRLCELESEIRDFKSSILDYSSAVGINNKNKAKNQWARPDSDRRSPPCQGSLEWLYQPLESAELISYPARPFAFSSSSSFRTSTSV